MEAVTIHINETVACDQRKAIAQIVKGCKGVRAVCHYDEKPYLLMIEYNPYAVASHELIQVILRHGLHAEVIGL